MATFIPLPYGIKLEISWTTGSGIALAVLFCSKTSPATVVAADLENACSAGDTLRLGLRNVQNIGVQVAGIRATDWTRPEGLTNIIFPSVTPFGVKTNPILPLNVALCASHVTGMTGRSRHGRTFVAGASEDEVSVGDLISATALAAIPAAFDAFRAALLGFNLVHCVASFYANKLPRTVGVGTAVARTSVDSYSDSQRRRLAGRGA